MSDTPLTLRQELHQLAAHAAALINGQPHPLIRDGLHAFFVERFEQERRLGEQNLAAFGLPFAQGAAK